MTRHNRPLAISALLMLVSACAPPEPEPWDGDGSASNTLPPSGDDGGELVCTSNEVPTQATCGEDECSCASACTSNEECTSGCCVDGYCAFACVCNGEGSVLYDCDADPPDDSAGNGCLDPCDDDFECDPGLECLDTTDGLKCLLPECAICFGYGEACTTGSTCSESTTALDSLCCVPRVFDDTLGQWSPCEDNTNPYLDTLCCVYTYSDDDGGTSGPCCDPFAQECPVGEGCYVSGHEGRDWACTVDVSDSGGAYGEPCEFGNACDPGLFCIDADSVPDCGSSVGCCTPYCNVTDPDSSANCPGSAGGQECLPFFEEGSAPTDLCFDASVLGVCSIP